MKRILMIILGCFAIFFSGILISMILFVNSHKLNGEKVFRVFISDPIPAGVKIVSGHGMWWQGYSAAVIFKSDDDIFREIARDYQRLPGCIDKSIYEGGIDARAGKTHVFAEDLMSIPDMSCYYRRIDLRHGGDAYLFYDKGNKKIFFCVNGG